uniref:PR domain zinc finger protein 8 n=1 Tax=Corvus moneduloides TaxID=1196302 RepID=A0A8C3D9G3_CORMO
MEDAGVQRGIWDGDAKTVQQCLTDIFTSVYTTCDIPENAIFGPCVLSHTSLYDSIAFIALKSTDKRTVPYIFRVDTSAANGSSEGLMWLRLVQSAREREEQNLEAYIKSGQLFYRSLRRIAKDEELLVWYGKELTELLLLGPARAPARTNGSPPFACPECSQRFQFELPFAAHLRFRCPKRLHGPDTGPAAEAAGVKDGAGKEQEPGKFGKPGGPPHHPFPGPDGGPAATAAAVGADAAAAVVHLAVPAGSKLVRQVQRVLPHDLGPGLPHALPPQEGIRAGAPRQAPPRGEAQVPHLQRVLPRAPSPLPPHDLPQLARTTLRPREPARDPRPGDPRPARRSHPSPSMHAFPLSGEGRGGRGRGEGEEEGKREGKS